MILNKRYITIAAIAMFVVGIVGSIWSMLYAMPGIEEYANDRRYEDSQEYNLYEKNIEIDKLVIDGAVSDINIKYHNKDTVLVTKKGISNNINYSISNEEKTLRILEEGKNNVPSGFALSNYEPKDFVNIDSIVKDFLNSILSEDTKSLTVYVPHRVDLVINKGWGSIDIDDGVFGSKMCLSSDNYLNAHNMSFSKEIRDLKELKITADELVTLSDSELLGIKNIEISSPSVDILYNINDEGNGEFETKIAENFTIRDGINNSDQIGDVYIKSNIPISKNLTIEATSSKLDMEFPTDKYKFNYNIYSSQKEPIVNYYGDADIEQYEETDDGNKLPEVNIKGIVNKDTEKLDKQYNVNAKVGYIRQEN